MPMPEATVHEQYGPMLRKNKIRAAGKISAMQPEPHSQLM